MRDAAKLVKLARRAGCEVTKTRRGHYRVVCPGGGIVIVARSGDWHAVRNAARDLRAQGVAL
jgi:hypothetical protein